MLIVIAGLFVAVAPQDTNCEAQGGTMPMGVASAPDSALSHVTVLSSMQTNDCDTSVPTMKCLWSMPGALAVGASLAVAGV